MDSPRARLENALRDSEPSRAVSALALILGDEGMSQLDMYRLFDDFRAIHESDTDETLYDAILDTMDVISGWCSPSPDFMTPNSHPTLPNHAPQRTAEGHRACNRCAPVPVRLPDAVLLEEEPAANRHSFRFGADEGCGSEDHESFWRCARTADRSYSR